ncbi:MAG: permease of phosphate ABC transporter [Lachnospiraceae bacterium]
MKQLIELGNRYAKQSDWKDFALVKFCLCAIGIIIGLNIPKEDKKFAQGLSIVVFITTYVILMKKVFHFIFSDTEIN